jgi:predicted exporter
MPTRRATSILAAWFSILLAAVWHLTGTTVSTDLTQFMPTGSTDKQQLVAQLLREGPSSRTLLIGLKGASATDLARLSRLLAEQLDDSGLFTQVRNGGVSSSGNGMELLFRYRYLLDPSIDEESFSASALHAELRKRLAELSGPLGVLDRTSLITDPTTSMRNILLSWNTQDSPRMQDGVWFSQDGQEALLLAVTHASGYDAEAQQAAISAIEHAFEEPPFRTGAILEISGSPVFAKSARDSIRGDIQMLSTAGGVLIMLILLFAFRSPRLVLLSVLPLLTALVMGSAITSMMFGGLHGITLAFGITMLGVAIDYPVHLFSHLSRSGTAAKAIRNIWPTLRLGVITTCIGYLAFARRDFQGLAQLGVFATSGLLSAAIVTRWLLPSLINTPPAHAPWQMHVPQMPNLSRPLAGIVVLGTMVGLVAIYSLSPPAWENELSELSPISSESRAQEARLRRALGAADVSQLIVLRSNDLDQALEHSEQVAQRLLQAVSEGRLSGFDYAARYLPSAGTQRQRQAFLPDEISIRNNLDEALQGLPFKTNTFDPFLRDLAASRQFLPLTLDEIRGSPIEARIAPLLFHDNGHWNAIISLKGISDASSFQAWWEEQSIGSAQYIDLKNVSTSMLIDFRDSALEYVLLGVAGIWLTLVLGLRSLRRASLILLPILIATTLSAAVLGVIGERLSLFHLIALLLVTGIGIDYSLFFQRATTSDRDHRTDLQAVLICALSSLAVFGILAFSPTPVLKAIGLTVTIGIPLSFLLALAFSRLTASSHTNP